MADSEAGRPEVSISLKPLSAPAEPASIALPNVSEASDRQPMSLAFKAHSIVEAFQDRYPNARELEEMTRAFGIEIVTMALCRILAQVTPNRYFLEQVEGLMRESGQWRDGRVEHAADVKKPIGKGFELAIIESVDPSVPGAKWGSHVTAWKKLARRAGLTTDVIHTKKSGSLIRNAEIIRQALAARPHDHRIIATVGQGGAEFRLLLEQVLKTTPEELEGVRAWINVNGLIRGASGLAMRQRRWWDRRAVGLSSALRGWPLSLPEQLSTRNPRLKADIDLVGLPLVCVSMVGMPTVRDVPLGLKRLHLELSKLGPNNGLAMFHEMILRPGYIVPVPSLSHRTESDVLAPWFMATLKALTLRG